MPSCKVCELSILYYSIYGTRFIEILLVAVARTNWIQKIGFKIGKSNVAISSQFVYNNSDALELFPHFLQYLICRVKKSLSPFDQWILMEVDLTEDL